MPFEISWIAFLGYFAALAITLVMFLSPIILCAVRERSRSMLIVGFIVGLAIMAITVIAALSDPDGTLDSLALQTNRITSIAVSSSNGEIESSLVCGEDGVQSIKVLEDLRAETIECSYNKDGVRQILDLALTPNHPVTIVEERWGHKNRVWGLQSRVSKNIFVQDESEDYTIVTTETYTNGRNVTKIEHIPRGEEIFVNLEDQEFTSSARGDDSSTTTTTTTSSGTTSTTMTAIAADDPTDNDGAEK